MSTTTGTQVSDDVHLIRVDDGAVNALTLALIGDLAAAIAAAPPGSALVIAGREGCLTAGLDRGAMLSDDRAAVTTILRRVTELYDRILDHPAPTVIACTGHAIAAGALLLLVADVRVGAAVPSKIGFNETQIGLPLGPLAVAAARARLAPQAFVRATLHGAVYNADAAVDIGYLDELTAANGVIDRAIVRAGMLAAVNRRAYLRTRDLVWSPVRAEVAAAVDRSRSRTAADAKA